MRKASSEDRDANLAETGAQYECRFENKLNSEEETQIFKIVKIRVCWIKVILLLPILTILTGGIVLLFIIWYVDVMYYLIFWRAKELDNASFLLVYSCRNQKEIVYIRRGTSFCLLNLTLDTAQNQYTENGQQLSEKEETMRFSSGYKKINSSIPTFNFRYSKYFYSEEDAMFVPIEFDTSKTYDVIHNTYSKVLQEGQQIDHLVSLYGRGNITIKEKNIFIALVTDIINPFYIFQVFSFIIWFLTEYEIYSYCIIFLTVVSLVMELVFLKISFYRLKKLSKYECNIKVIRKNAEGIEEVTEVNSD